jgi:hypothetical protein
MGKTGHSHGLGTLSLFLHFPHSHPYAKIYGLQVTTKRLHIVNWF